MARPDISARNSRTATGQADLPMIRVVLFTLLLVPVAALWWALTTQPSGPSTMAQQLAQFNPRSLFQDQASSGFLPPPVAAIPAEAGAGPPVPAASEESPATATERVKIANTGGAGAILRAEPPRGRQVGALRDGQVLDVLERRQVDGDEWLRVKTPEGAEGWVYGRLVGPAG